MIFLVTGAGGFIGSHLAEFLILEGHKVHLFSRKKNSLLDKLGSHSSIHIGDIKDEKYINQIIQNTKPDVIIHLAAQSFPTHSWEEPVSTFNVNVNGTINILESVRKAGNDTLVISVCSSAEYAPSTNSDPIKECQDLIPSNPYGVSKLAQDHITRVYGEMYSIRTIRCRPFFLVGARKDGDVYSSFAKQIVRIERNNKIVFRVGNLDNVRDILDIHDGVRAIYTLCEKGKTGEVYNICSGEGHSIKNILNTMKSLTNVEINEKIDHSLIRAKDERVVVGDPSKIKGLGWSPRYKLKTTLKDILDYWRSKEQKSSAE